MRNLVLIVFIAFLILFCVFAALNYNCLVQSDPSTYLSFARSISKGDYFVDYPPERLLLENLPSDNYYAGFYSRVISDGRSFPFVAIIYPLFLSLFFLLGGIYAPFFANAVVFAALFVALYVFTGLIFRGHKNYRFMAILTVLLYFLLNKGKIISLLRCYRDPLSYLFIIIGFCFYLMFFRTEKKRKYLALTALFIGFACSVRETSAICLLPMGLLYLIRGIRDKSLHVFRYGSVFFIFLVIGSSPLIVQNSINTGHPLHSTQNLVRGGLEHENDWGDKTDIAGFVVPGSKLEYFPKTSSRYLKKLWRTYGTIPLILLIAGFVYGRRSDEIKYLLLPFIASYFLFYSFFSVALWRYLFVIQIAAVPVIAFAVVRFTDSAVKSRKKYVYRVLLLLMFALSAYSMFGKMPEKQFRIAEAMRFKKDFDNIIPANSAVIAEATMRSHIDYFTDSYCFRFDDFVRPEHGISAVTGLKYYMANFQNVYFFDNVDLSLLHKYNHTPSVKGQILEHFDLIAQEEFHADEYNLRKLFGKPFCTLWKLEKWGENFAEQSIEIEKFEDSILRINARKLWNNDLERMNAKLYFNDELLSSSIVDGVNYFYLPKELMQKGASIVKLASDAPVPANIDPVIFSVRKPIIINIDKKPRIIEANYVLDDFHWETRREDTAGSSLVAKARIKIPTIKYPESFLLVSCRIRVISETASDCILTFLLNGKKQSELRITGADGRKNRKNMKFPIDDDDITADTSELLLNVEIINPQTAEELYSQNLLSFLSIDHVTVHRQDNSGSRILIDIGSDDDILLGSGFYNKERFAEGQTARWTKDEARVYLPYMRRKGKLSLEISASGASKEVGDIMSEVFINDHKIGEIKVPPVSRKRFVLEVPDEILVTGFNDLMFKTPTWRPSDFLSSTDNRELGILLESITLHYVDESVEESEY